MTVVNDRPRSLTFGHSAYCNIIPNVMPPCNIVVMPVDGVLTRKITRLNTGSLKAFIYVFKLMHDNYSNLCHKYSINIVGLYKVSLCYNLPRQSSIFSKCPFFTFKLSCDCQEFIAAHIWRNSDDSFQPKASRAGIIVRQPLLFTMAIHGAAISSCIILIVLASMFSGYIINLWPLLPPH